MRGKGTSLRNFKSDERITPAYAGKSFQLGDVPAVQKDHPRLCGEKMQAREAAGLPAGSPPPMRGKGSYGYQTLSPCRDHPRLCGEKVLLAPLTKRALGSPPPMRGKALRRQSACRSRGITPAYAGKSRTFATSCYCIQDHPRLCGEKAKKARQTREALGSPPPMRGKDRKIS